MENRYLANLNCLTMAQKIMLAKGKLQTVSDLLKGKGSDHAKKCKVTSSEMEAIIDLVCKELYKPPTLLRDIADVGEEHFTTGDTVLDSVLGGGIYTGMLWELSGENNAGKTQLALQLSLACQLPHSLGGVAGSTCYISTREELRTERLQQMIDSNPVLTAQHCELSNIHTLQAYNFGAFNRVLQETIPGFIDNRAASSQIPVKLIVVDTFTDLFDRDKHTEFRDHIHRADSLRSAALQLQRLASRYRVAIVILGSTRPTRPRIEGEDKGADELRYSDQARWFARAHTVTSEDANEAILGHIWPNQLNARIMMSRTIRTRIRAEVDPAFENLDNGRAAKRRRLDNDSATTTQSSQPDGDEPVAFRRFSVIFSSVTSPASCDYVILKQGVVAFAAEEPPPSTYMYATPTPPPPSASSFDSTRESSRGYVGSLRGPPSAYTTAPSAPSTQSLSYVTAPSSLHSTPPPTVTPSIMSEEEDAMLWSLTQEQGDLFDSMLDNEVEHKEAEDGPPVSEDHHSSDSELWRNFDSDLD